MLFVFGLAVYAVRAIGWPLVGGRDLDEYLYTYIQLLDRHPALPWPMLFRTPVTPIVAGLSLDVAGGFFAEPLLAVLFAASVVAWAVAARRFGARTALLVAVALLVYPAYGLMFHELSSEPMTAAAFALWALLMARAAAQPSTGRWLAAGLGVALLALVRPGNVVLVLIAVFPFVLGRSSWRRSTEWGLAFVLAALVPLAGWAVVNGLRFGDYTLARGGNAVIPFYRAFISDRIVSPQNGPASRRLAQAIEQHLLTRDPYRAYGVTLNRVFTSGSFRIHEDLYLLSDEYFGWDTNYSILRKAGIEAVKAHPGRYTSGVASTVWHQLSRSDFRSLPGPATPAAPAAPTVHTGSGKTLPKPTEGQPIPAGQSAWISRPDHCIRDVWTSATTHHFVFCNQRVRSRFFAIQRKLDSLFRALPDRRGNAQLGLRLNQLSRWFPRMILWIAVGLIGLVLRRPRGAMTLLTIAVGAFMIILLNALGLFADPHFALPVAPAFVLLGAGGLLARR